MCVHRRNTTISSYFINMSLISVIYVLESDKSKEKLQILLSYGEKMDIIALLNWKERISINTAITSIQNANLSLHDYAAHIYQVNGNCRNLSQYDTHRFLPRRNCQSSLFYAKIIVVPVYDCWLSLRISTMNSPFALWCILSPRSR